MQKKTKAWLVAATVSIVVGCVLVVIAMAGNHWDFRKFSTINYETNTYEIPNTFRSISIVADTTDIRFSISDDECCKVICHEDAKEKHLVAVQDSTLIICPVNEKKWYDHIGISFGTPKITVFLPEAQYECLSIEGSTGDIEIPGDFHFVSMVLSVSTGDITDYASAEMINIKAGTGGIHLEKASAETVDLSTTTGGITVTDVICSRNFTVHVSTGKVNLDNVRCERLTSTGNTGDISLNNVIASGTYHIERSTGDVRFSGSDAAEIYVKTDTGDVSGTLLTEKIFFAQTDTGDIDVPQSVIGGTCKITTNTGDVTITLN